MAQPMQWAPVHGGSDLYRAFCHMTNSIYTKLELQSWCIVAICHWQVSMKRLAI